MRFQVSLDAAFLKKSYARRMFRGWWKLMIAALLILFSVLVPTEDGRLSVVSIFGLSGLAIMIAIYPLAWFRQSKAIDAWLRAQGAAPVVYSLTEEEVESSSNVGSTKVKWSALSGAVITDFDTLLMFQGSAGALTLPTQQIPDDAILLLKERLSVLGKKVEDRRKEANQPPEPTAPNGRG